MPYVVIYDITRDSLRNRVANKLKDYGLNRIQYSAFVGDLRARNLRSLVIDLKKLLGKVGKEMEGERRLVHIFPVPFSSLESVIVIGEWKEEKEEKRAKIF
ncbi:MAG: CRISPR-associated endonuclease Cas2 [Thermoproteota archaeon]|nr:MAG: CRISPR-associated endonuclease Cas2 [Candidatus Korarchaeota archaeon]